METALSNSLNAWALANELLALYSERDEIARSGESDELRVMDTAIERYVETKVADVTDLRGLYFAVLDAAGVAVKEAERANARCMQMHAYADRIKDGIGACMERLGKKRFESAMGFFRLQGNGGNEPVEITNDSMIPVEFWDAELKLPLNAWNSMVDALEEIGYPGLRDELPAPRRVLSRSRVGDALRRNEGVPGARLAPRGKSVVIK